MNIFEKTRIRLNNQGLRIERYELNRPWGGFFVLDENQAQEFADIYFEGLDVAPLRIGGKLSPKILLVKPEARLSWQYHYRRAETWRVVEGPVGIVLSTSNEEGELVSYEAGKTIFLEKGQRHRLIGLENWGVVAEFWQHTDSNYPSDEDDIVRIQDDYARK
ncbi:phosphoheptose isomerase [Schleiferiaceae bacterium]|nr:phosphoheptose isomerase [Schleiferiaceae bacterium]